jgi:hypothetical protein
MFFDNQPFSQQWNAIMNIKQNNDLGANNVRKDIYSDCVFTSKTLLLKSAKSLEIQIDESKFLELTFQKLATTNRFLGRDPRMKTQISLYEIDETASQIRDRFINLAFGGEIR